jgi:hypothetical protein
MGTGHDMPVPFHMHKWPPYHHRSFPVIDFVRTSVIFARSVVKLFSVTSGAIMQGKDDEHQIVKQYPKAYFTDL